jgi:hypothetical protein
MVAAFGSREGLSPAVARGILAFIIVGLIAALAIKDRIALHRRIPFENSPEILVECSHEILKKLGFTEKFEDSAYGFTINAALVTYQNNWDRKADRGRNWDVKTILFWYRQSPRSFQFQSGTFSQDNPPLKHPGEVLVQLDTEGRLVSLSRVPSQAQSKAETAPLPDWDSLFAEAGLEYSQWKEQETQWIPDSYADFKTAWIGLLPGFPEAEARIQGASYRGRPVRFTIIGPWLPSDQTESPQRPLRGTVAILGYLLIIVSAVLGGILFARRNMRLGRGDRRNANRLALFVFCVTVLWWACGWPHFSFNNLPLAPYLAALVWIIYMAIEPFVRRRWPSTLVS